MWNTGATGFIPGQATDCQQIKSVGDFRDLEPKL